MKHLIQRASPLALAVALVSASLLIAFALPTPVQAVAAGPDGVAHERPQV